MLHFPASHVSLLEGRSNPNLVNLMMDFFSIQSTENLEMDLKTDRKTGRRTVSVFSFHFLGFLLKPTQDLSKPFGPFAAGKMKKAARWAPTIVINGVITPINGLITG